MNQYNPPFDDTVQLSEMQVDVSDNAPIVRNEYLRNGQVVDEEPRVEIRDGDTRHISTNRGIVIVAILFGINLLNYMDRFTIAGVLKKIQDYYDINNKEAGLLQTAFIGSYMIFSPVFGYLGDRFTRKYIMAGGILFWACVTFAGSFIPQDHFWAFVLLRCMVGVGEASYSTIAPTIIADMFSAGQRTRALMCFYFAIPVGSGLGYIVGANVAELFHAWQYALRVTPVLGLICVVLILVVVKEPIRGQADGGTHLHNTAFLTDLWVLLHNKSFMLSTLAFTCVAFTTGALALWAPLFIYDSITMQGVSTTESSVAIKFGIITVVAGFLGVALGAEGSKWFKKRNPRADPLVCAFGMLLCTPFLFLALVVSRYNTPLALTLVFLGEVALCLNWPIIADMLLYVVIPTRRSAAESVQILISHLLGDAGSPFLIGAISDSISAGYNGNPHSPAIQFVALQKSLYITTFVCVLGGGLFLATALFIEEDKKRAQQLTQVGISTDTTDGDTDDELPIILHEETPDGDDLLPIA